MVIYLKARNECAGVAELADARDLKSRDTKVSYGFDSRFRHHIAEWSSLVARRAHNPKVVWFKSRPRNQTKPCEHWIHKAFCVSCHSEADRSKWK